MILEYKTDSISCKITYNTGLLSVKSKLLVLVLDQISNLHIMLPSSMIEFKKQNGSYLYEITFLDARVWTQMLTFDIPDNPLMTFAVDAFRLSEIIQQRDLRLALIQLKLTYDVTAFEYEVLP